MNITKSHGFHIQQMSYTEAEQISKWTYQEPYSIYSMNGGVECLNELLDGSYYSVFDNESYLIGYYCFGKSAQVPVGNLYGAYDCNDYTDIGLGIRPDLCGQGWGERFLSAGMDFARSELSVKKFRLTVAMFNQRAIKVYERVGFKKAITFLRVSESENMEFIVMEFSSKTKGHSVF